MAVGTATLITMGIIGASTAVSAIGQKKAGTAAEELGEFNAQVADTQAAEELVIGKEDEDRFRTGVRGLIGRQRAGFAGQNVDVGVGSAVDVVADSAFLGELDALTIRTNAMRSAWGYTVQAENFRRGGTAANTASKFNAAGTILGGASSLLSLRNGFS